MHKLCRSTLSAVILVISAGCGSDQPSDSPIGASRTLASTASTSSDRVTIAGNRAAFTITRTDAGYTVTPAGGGQSISVPGNIRVVAFDDMSVSLAIGEKAKSIAKSELKTLTELYIAFFNRVPDGEGLAYWIDQYTAGMTIDQIADAFYGAAVQFSALTGYDASMSAADFVRVIYKNVLGRTGASAPPDSDVQFWVSELTNQRATKGSLVRAMLNSAHTFAYDPTWGWVAALLENKYLVGEYFAVQNGLSFTTPESSISRTMEIAAAVTPTDMFAALNKVKTSDPSFNLYVTPPVNTVPAAPMRAAHMMGNWAGNQQGIRTAVDGYFAGAKALSAQTVSVSVNRGSYIDGSGVTQTNDIADVVMTNVKVGSTTHAKAGFWIGRNAGTGAMFIQFRPTISPSLANIAGFNGDMTFSVPGNAMTMDLTAMSQATGDAHDLVLAILANGAGLFEHASLTSAGGATLDNAAIMAAFQVLSTRHQKVQDEYFQFLKEQNIQWLGISVAMFYDNLADPTVKSVYRPAGKTGFGLYTFADEDLKRFITKAKRLGFKVYLTLAFEHTDPFVIAADAGCGTMQYKPERFVLGKPVVTADGYREACINPAHWWWNPLHPDYAAKTATFWGTYTEVAVRYATMAQELGVDMYSLGTETDTLFRSQPGPDVWNNHFAPQLKEMVRRVRAVYTGVLTYDLGHNAIRYQFPGTASLFSDLGLDVIGVSAYFPLTAATPTRVLNPTELDAAWNTVFQDYLRPYQQNNGGKPLIFTEFGYTDSLGSAFIHSSEEGLPIPNRSYTVNTPGMEQQKNIFESFFRVNEQNGHLVRGAFIWGTGVFSDYPSVCTNVDFSIYCKPSQQSIKAIYSK